MGLEAVYEALFLLSSLQGLFESQLELFKNSKIYSIRIPNIKVTFPKYFSADRYNFPNPNMKVKKEESIIRKMA
jgi:hypothetical protein